MVKLDSKTHNFRRHVHGNRGLLARLACALLLLVAWPAYADNCSDYPGGIVDGAVGAAAPATLRIDRDCTIRNFPASNPFATDIRPRPGGATDNWMLVLDNVVHTGRATCNRSAGFLIWFANSVSSSIPEDCKDLLLEIEKIDKSNPTGTATATVGVPFTYRITLPVAFDPGRGEVSNPDGSPNELSGVVVTDDLTASGADLSYVSHRILWRGSGTPVPHSFINFGGKLTFANLPVIPARRQIDIEVTVVLDDTPGNTIGREFRNTARGELSRVAGNIPRHDLPAQSGTTPTMTIAGPDLVVAKAGPATINLGESAQFTLDVRNAGSSDAWHTTLVDRLPDGPDGGMCNSKPVVESARVFAADGVTPVPGKRRLVRGADYRITYTGAPTCEFTLRTFTAESTIAPGERLIVTYRSSLDDDTRVGVPLTNVAGATQWFNGDGIDGGRQTYTRVLTDGTVGSTDHEDAHTVTSALSGVFFEKSVANRSQGTNPATTAAPGDLLRYTLRVRTTDAPLTGAELRDEMGALNASPVFEPGTLALVPGTIPAGADVSGTDSSGGRHAGGILHISDLDLAADSEISVQFDIRLAASIADSTIVTNQAGLYEGLKLADSDDPHVNGSASPLIDGDEDPTRILIEAAPPSGLTKTELQSVATIGELIRYRLTVPSAPHTAPLYDVRIVDDLLAAAADLGFVEVNKISGSGPWTPQNTGSDTDLVIADPVHGIDIPAGEQAQIEIVLRLLDTPANVAGLSFANNASYTYNLVDDDAASELNGGAGKSGLTTILEPELTLAKSGPPTMQAGEPATFTIDVQNVGDSPAYATTVTDLIPNTAPGGMCETPPVLSSAQIFAADGATPVSAPLVEGVDFVTTFDVGPLCAYTFTMTSDAAAIGIDQRLIITYRAWLDADTELDATFTNVAGASSWTGLDATVPHDEARRYSRAVTDGTAGVTDHQDAHTVLVVGTKLIFEKTVANLASGADPAIAAAPGDRLRYSLRIENAGDLALENFRVVDELDRLNSEPGFRAGSLELVTVPAGADASGTDAAGGAAGTGVIDIGGLNLAGRGDSLLIVFEVELAAGLANESFVANQAEIRHAGLAIALSDDPHVDGAADPKIAGDEDVTRVRIESAPALRVEKVSTYLDGEPHELLAGETLRYTITVQNTGSENLRGVRLVDHVPANTSYVAGSTTLNGITVADAEDGGSPLVDGLLINAPQDTTPGALNAVAGHVATVVFEVVVEPDTPDGTVISNQGFVSATGHGIADQPSDDPRTELADDPTRDVVGDSPLLFAVKTAALEADLGTPGLVDPGDVVRYTITVHNDGRAAATAARLIDALPANTSYVADSLTLNGAPLADPATGEFPLAAGIALSSTDRTPPLPGDGEGVISPGAAATVQFDLRVNDDVAGGTLITNQALVESARITGLLTDADGNPATGPEPTVVVVGDRQQMAIVKEVAVLDGGAALAGALLEYTVTVRNIGSVAAQHVVITDDLNAAQSGYLGYLAGSAHLNGRPAGVSVERAVIRADYGSLNGALQPGETITLRFRARINRKLPSGATLTNIAEVAWDRPARTATSSVSVDVGARPGVALLSGKVWHDADHDDNADADERPLEGWSVEILSGPRSLRSVLTDAEGRFVIAAVAPNEVTGDSYSLRFMAPGANEDTATLGETDSAFLDGLQQINGIRVGEGRILSALNMPVDPNGVIYDSVARTPIAGAKLTMFDARNGRAVPANCFDDPNQQGQVTVANGYYQFALNFSDPACPGGIPYYIELEPPGTHYLGGLSELIPPASDVTEPAFDVPACLGGATDAVPATPDHCEAQASALPPDTSVPARSERTRYRAFFKASGARLPGSAQLFNNHIPMDPRLNGAVAMSKTSPKVNVSRGQMVPYIITVRNTYGVELTDVDVIDRFPPGFRYVPGSARLNDVETEPAIAGRELTWRNLTLPVDTEQTIKLLLTVGAGVSDGEFVNRAQALNSISGAPMSDEAQATVRLVPDPSFDCTDITGKVFDDGNRNGYQDRGEGGIAGVRVVTMTGLAATTDQHGRYHFTCAITPHESRGSNFVLKIDDRTLPTGFRTSTRPVQVQRATRGKALRVNFGASIHHVVGIDIADAVFEPGTVEMRPQWRPRIATLIEELQKRPSVLRLSYVADVEPEALVKRRLETLKDQIAAQWQALDCCYELVIEPDIFWRRGAPPGKQKGVRQ